MEIDEIRAEISSFTGVPMDLLTGSTAEENIQRAKALLAYKKEAATGTENKSPAEQFAEYFAGCFGEGGDGPDPAAPATQSPEGPHSLYPTVHDGGEPSFAAMREKTRDQFSAWLGSLG